MAFIPFALEGLALMDTLRFIEGDLFLDQWLFYGLHRDLDKTHHAHADLASDDFLCRSRVWKANEVSRKSLKSPAQICKRLHCW